MTELASGYVSLEPQVDRNFGSKFASRASGSMKKSGSGLGGVFGKAFALAGGVGIASFAKDAIAGASDIQESTSKIQAIFGDAGDAVLKFSEKGATALGQSKASVLDAAGTFGTFGKAAGLAGPELAKFSTGFVSLSTDLASFGNTSPEEAVEAIGSALRGEAEPMRKYGVLLDDATLRQEALRLGLVKTTKEALTPQQKVLAAQSAIYKQTKDAQGDFARTSGGLANQQRILSAQWTDMKARIGAALLPVVTRFVTFLNSRMVPAFAKVQAVAKDVTSWLGDKLGPVIERVRDFIAQNPTVVKAFAIALGVLALAIGAVTLATTLFSIALNSTGIPLVIIAIAALVAGLVYAYQKSEAFRSIVQQVGQILQSFAAWVRSDVVPVVLELAQKVGDHLRPILEQLVATFKSDVLPTVQKVLAKFREWQPTIQKVAAFVVQLVAKWISFYTMILGKVLPVVIRFVGFILKNVVPAILQWVQNVATVISKVIEFGRVLVNGVKDAAKFAKGIGDKIDDVLRWFRQLPGKILDKLGDLGSILLDAGEQIMDGLWDGLKDKWEDVEDWFGDVTGSIADLKGPPERDRKLLTPAGRQIMEGLLRGLNVGQVNLVKKLKDVTEQIANLLQRGKIGQDLARQMRQVVDGIAKEAAKLRSLVGKRSALAKDLASSFRDELDLVALTDGGTNEFGFATPVSAGVAIAGVQAFVARLRAFAGKLRKLAKAGIPGALIGEIAGLGSEAGARVADVFLGATRQQVRTLRVAFQGINSAANAAGLAGANGMYGAQIRRQREELAELLGRDRGNAREVGREVARALQQADLQLMVDGRGGGRIVLAGRNHIDGHD